MKAIQSLALRMTLRAQQPQFALIQQACRGLKSPPNYNPEEDYNKINSFNGDLAAYFDDLMKRRPQNEGGYINLPRENYKLMVQRAKNEKDLETLVFAHVNYLGHRNLIPHSYVDLMLLKALELGQPSAMLKTLELHAELIYHPSTKVLQKYLDHFKAASYEEFKAFFTAVKGNQLLQKPTELHRTAIDLAYSNNDGRTVVNAYLDILDYEAADLTVDHLKKVYDSLNYDVAVDHLLIDHLGKQSVKINASSDPTIKLHQALYFYKVKGYLTAVDIIQEAALSQVGKIGKSSTLKKHFFDALFSDEALDADTKGQIVGALRNFSSDRWEDLEFYGISEHLKVPEKEEAPIKPESPVAEEQAQQQ